MRIQLQSASVIARLARSLLLLLVFSLPLSVFSSFPHHSIAVSVPLVSFAILLVRSIKDVASSRSSLVRYIDARQATLCVQLDNPSSYDIPDKVHCFTTSVDPAFYRTRRRGIEY